MRNRNGGTGQSPAQRGESEPTLTQTRKSKFEIRICLNLKSFIARIGQDAVRREHQGGGASQAVRALVYYLYGNSKFHKRSILDSEEH